MKFSKSLSTILVSYGAIASTASMADEDASADAVAGVLEEIVVSAERSPKSLYDTPMSLTAYDGGRLDKSDLVDMESVALTTSSVYYDQGSNNIYVRGIGGGAGGIGADPSVSQYVDGVFLPRSGFLETEFLDLERIEVLKGPQGTLYGRNATAGAIHYITRKPTQDSEGYIRAAYGRFQKFSLKGAVNTPLSDTVAVRLAFGRTVRDGHTLNLYNGEKLDNENNTTARASLVWQASDNVSVTLIADYFRENDTGPVESYVSPQPNFAAIGEPQPEDPFVVSINFPQRVETELWGLTGIVDWNAGGFDVKSTTSYREGDGFISFDNDRSSLSLIQYYGNNNSETFQEDIQISNKSSDVFEFIAGANYFHEKGSQDQSFWGNQDKVNFVGTDLAGGVTVNVNAFAELKTDAYSTFVEGTLKLGQNFRATGGVRYSYEKKSTTGGNPGSTFEGPLDAMGLPIFSGTFGGTSNGSDHWDAYTPRAVLEYDLTDQLMIYASASRGFKSGGFGFASTNSFDPEIVWNYEGGLKGSILERRVLFAIAAFHSDYTDFQVSELEVIGGVPVFTASNAGSANINGAEFEISAQLDGGMQLSAYGSYLDAKYSVFPDVEDGVAVDYAGNRLPYAPKWKLGMSAEYTFKPFAAGEGFWAGDLSLRADTTWQSRMETKEHNDPITTLDGFGLVNARAAYSTDDSAWEITLFVRNLFDNLYYNRRFDHFELFGEGTYSVRVGEPRTWVVQVNAKF